MLLSTCAFFFFFFFFFFFSLSLSLSFQLFAVLRLGSSCGSSFSSDKDFPQVLRLGSSKAPEFENARHEHDLLDIWPSLDCHASSLGGGGLQDDSLVEEGHPYKRLKSSGAEASTISTSSSDHPYFYFEADSSEPALLVRQDRMTLANLQHLLFLSPIERISVLLSADISIPFFGISGAVPYHFQVKNR